MGNTSKSSSTNNNKNRLNIFYFLYLLFFSINHIHKDREVILHSINSKNINKRYEFYAIHNIIVIFLVPTGSSWLLSHCSYISICPCSIKSEVVTMSSLYYGDTLNSFLLGSCNSVVCFRRNVFWTIACLLSFVFWSLYFLSLDFRILVTPLVSSNFSF